MGIGNKYIYKPFGGRGGSLVLLRKTKPRGVASEYLKQVLDIRSAPTEGEPYGLSSLALLLK